MPSRCTSGLSEAVSLAIATSMHQSGDPRTSSLPAISRGVSKQSGQLRSEEKWRLPERTAGWSSLREAEESLAMDNIKARVESSTEPAPCPLAHSRAIRHDRAPTQGEQQGQREQEEREQGHETGWDESPRQDRSRERGRAMSEISSLQLGLDSSLAEALPRPPKSWHPHLGDHQAFQLRIPHRTAALHP
jgi:hypothetical protein